MSENEKRAHDFAIAAVNAYQSADNEKRIKNNNSPHYDLSSLINVYCEAFAAMDAELCKKDYQSRR